MSLTQDSHDNTTDCGKSKCDECGNIWVRLMKTYAPGRSCIYSYQDGLNAIDRSSEREMVALTGPRFRVNTNARWALKITKKYLVASSAIVLKIVGILSARFSGFAARKMIEKNARESNYSRFLQVSVTLFYFYINPTHHIRGRCLYTQPLGIYDGRIRRGGTHRAVSPEGAGLHITERCEKGSLDSETSQPYSL